MSLQDLDKLKRSSIGFYIFLDELKKSLKEEHIESKNVVVVGKANGEKWKNIFQIEKSL